MTRHTSIDDTMAAIMMDSAEIRDLRSRAIVRRDDALEAECTRALAGSIGARVTCYRAAQRERGFVVQLESLVPWGPTREPDTIVVDTWRGS